MSESAIAESVRHLESEATRTQFALREAERGLVTARRQLFSARCLRAFLNSAKWVRKFLDASIVWRPGAILICVTAFGGSAFCCDTVACIWHCRRHFGQQRWP